MRESGEIRDEVLDELHAYYLGPGEFYGSDKLLERLSRAVIALAEIEEARLGGPKAKKRAGSPR